MSRAIKYSNLVAKLVDIQHRVVDIVVAVVDMDWDKLEMYSIISIKYIHDNQPFI